jgi:hypothetical protein
MDRILWMRIGGMESGESPFRQLLLFRGGTDFFRRRHKLNRYLSLILIYWRMRGNGNDRPRPA